MNGNSNRPRVARWLAAPFAALVATATAHAKPPATLYADVEITFAGQTTGYSGLEQSFSLSEDGGRIVVDVHQLRLPGYAPLPDVDLGTIDRGGNYWTVQTNVNRQPYVLAGICASETYTTTEPGIVVRHLNLNCSELDAGAP